MSRGGAAGVGGSTKALQAPELKYELIWGHPLFDLVNTAHNVPFTFHLLSAYIIGTISQF